MATGEIALGLTISQSSGTQRVVGPQGSLRLLEVQQDTPLKEPVGPAEPGPGSSDQYTQPYLASVGLRT